MGIKPQHLRLLVEDTLRLLEPEVPYSEAAVELLLLTAAAESQLGHYLRQITGPARGVFQMEPETFSDIYLNYLVYRPELLSKVNSFSSAGNHYQVDIMGNIPMQAVYARVHYLRVKDPLPEIVYHRVNPEEGGSRVLTVRSVGALADYWKQHYNTHKGAGTPQHAMEAYRRFFHEQRRESNV